MDNAKDKRNALPTVQGDERCDADQTDRRTLHQDEGVLQPAHLQDQGSGDHRAKTKAVTIRWNEWNPFERATGKALKQLNRRYKKQTEIDGEEALL